MVSSKVSLPSRKFPVSCVRFPAEKIGNFLPNPLSVLNGIHFLAWKHFRGRKHFVSSKVSSPGRQPYGRRSGLALSGLSGHSQYSLAHVHSVSRLITRPLIECDRRASKPVTAPDLSHPSRSADYLSRPRRETARRR